MDSIFLSYRREDSTYVAGRLADHLISVFGREHVFRDVETISPGLDFHDVLQDALNQCAVMLVLIGPKWVHVQDREGNRRLEDPNDWCRTEIVTALDRGVRVIPVLVDDTQLPRADELPEQLAPLLRRQTVSIADTRWVGDTERLVRALRTIPGLGEQSPPDDLTPSRSSTSKLPLGLLTGVLLLAATAYGFKVMTDSVAEPQAGMADPARSARSVTPGPATPKSEPSVEARKMLGQIRTAELAYDAEFDTYTAVPACPPEPGPGQTFPSSCAGPWAALRWLPGGPVDCSYKVEVGMGARGPRGATERSGLWFLPSARCLIDGTVKTVLLEE